MAVANTNDFREAHTAQRGSGVPSLPNEAKEPAPQFNTSVFAPEPRSGVVEAPPVVEEEKSPVIVDYEKIIEDLVDHWTAKSDKIGQVVGEQVRFAWGVLQTELCRHKP